MVCLPRMPRQRQRRIRHLNTVTVLSIAKTMRLDSRLACADCGGDGRGGVAARSYHPGGVNVGMGDGSGRFVSETIDKALYRYLLTIAGEEPVSDF